jgi:hypothetical protein
MAILILMTTSILTKSACKIYLIRRYGDRARLAQATIRSQSPRKLALTPQVIIKKEKATVTNRYIMQRKATLGQILFNKHSSGIHMDSILPGS